MMTDQDETPAGVPLDGLAQFNREASPAERMGLYDLDAENGEAEFLFDKFNLGSNSAFKPGYMTSPDELQALLDSKSKDIRRDPRHLSTMKVPLVTMETGGVQVDLCIQQANARSGLEVQHGGYISVFPTLWLQVKRGSSTVALRLDSLSPDELEKMMDFFGDAIKLASVVSSELRDYSQAVVGSGEGFTSPELRGSAMQYLRSGAVRVKTQKAYRLFMGDLRTKINAIRETARQAIQSKQNVGEISGKPGADQ